MADRAVHGGKVFQLARSLQRLPEDILDFSASINPLGPPPSLKSAILDSFDHVRYYPDLDQAPLALYLAGAHAVPPAQLVLANGASEALDMAVRHSQARRVIVLDPAFSEYRSVARRNNRHILALPLNPYFAVPWADLLRYAHDGDIVILNNPHNPSGVTAYPDEWANGLRSLQAKGVLIVIDEAFLSFLPDSDALSWMQHAAEPKSRLVVVRSLTKFYAIPGLRLGYAVGDSDWVNAIHAQRDPWSVNHLAQVAGLAALTDEAFNQRTRRWLEEAQCQVQSLWPGSLPATVSFSPVNFFTVTWPTEDMAYRLAAELRHQGILVRENQGFSHWPTSAWRIALRHLNENQHLYDTVVKLFRQIL